MNLETGLGNRKCGLIVPYSLIKRGGMKDSIFSGKTKVFNGNTKRQEHYDSMKLTETSFPVTVNHP